MSSIDWRFAARVAGRFAGSHALEGTYHEARLADEAPGLVQRAAALVKAETGLHDSGEPLVAVVSRREWVEGNIESFSALLALAPAAKGLDTEKGMGAECTERILSVEIGLVLALLSRRVLGQYELVLPANGQHMGDTILFVGANLLAMERQQEFRPDEFRFWVALHECTHRLQFSGVEWLRRYFFDLVASLLGATPEPGRLLRAVRKVRNASTEGQPLLDESGLFGLLASPSQRNAIERVQALMSLLEGHGHVVMDRIGARELVTQDRMSALLKVRRQNSRTAFFMRLLGLEMKFRQYELGAAFVEGVERHAGWSALDRAWEGPENLPTLEEIGNPLLWLERVA